MWQSTLEPDPGNAGVGSLRKVRIFHKQPMRLRNAGAFFVFVYYL